jgi:hypothetical protein
MLVMMDKIGVSEKRPFRQKDTTQKIWGISPPHRF